MVLELDLDSFSMAVCCPLNTSSVPCLGTLPAVRISLLCWPLEDREVQEAACDGARFNPSYLGGRGRRITSHHQGSLSDPVSRIQWSAAASSLEVLSCHWTCLYRANSWVCDASFGPKLCKFREQFAKQQVLLTATFFFYFYFLCFPLGFLALKLPVFFFWMAKLLLGKKKKLFIITDF